MTCLIRINIKQLTQKANIVANNCEWGPYFLLSSLKINSVHPVGTLQFGYWIIKRPSRIVIIADHIIFCVSVILISFVRAL